MTDSSSDVWIHWPRPERCLRCFGERVIVTPVGEADCACAVDLWMLRAGDHRICLWSTPEEARTITSVAVVDAAEAFGVRPALRRDVVYAVEGFSRISEALLFPTREAAQAWCDRMNDRILAALGLRRAGEGG